MFRKSYGEVFDGDERWNSLEVPTGDRFAWDEDSTYVRLPPYFEGMPAEPGAGQRHRGRARAGAARRQRDDRPHLPGGSIKRDGPAGELPAGARRRAARLQLLRLTARQPRGDDARHVRQHPPAQPAGAGHRGRRDALSRPSPRGWLPASRCRSTTPPCATPSEGVPLVVLAGKEYGSGSSRDWAAKGTKLLGVRAVIAESFERIHRSNLVGMGVLPLQFPDGESAESLGLTGEEVFSIAGIAEAMNDGGGPPREVTVSRARRRRAGGVRGARADRHAQGGRVLPPRRHPPVRPASAARHHEWPTQAKGWPADRRRAGRRSTGRQSTGRRRAGRRRHPRRSCSTCSPRAGRRAMRRRRRRCGARRRARSPR